MKLRMSTFSPMFEFGKGYIHLCWWFIENVQMSKSKGYLAPNT